MPQVKVSGPKDGKIVTASFDSKKGKENAKSIFPSLRDTKDLVLLSIHGNEYCVGEYLDSIIKLAVDTHQNKDNNPARGKTTFLVADEIYWHNLKGMSNTESEMIALKEQAVHEGEEYLTNQLKYFLAPLGLTEDEFNIQYPGYTIDQKIFTINELAAKQGKNFEIMRWRTWINQNEGQARVNKMMPYYESVEGLKVPLDEEVETFASRHAKNSDNPEDDIELWRHRSRGYLTEESPAIMWLAASLGYNFVIYPGSLMAPFKATKDFFVVENHVAHISNGTNVKEECTHNDLCSHVKDPTRLVNWLQVSFQRSNPKQSLKVSDNGSGFFSAPVVKGAGAIEASSVAQMSQDRLASGREVDVVALNQLSKREKTEVTPLVADGSLTLFKKGKAEIMGELVEVGGDSYLASIINGVSAALINEYLDCTPKDKVAILKIRPQNTELTQMIQGLTQGVLKSELTHAEKIGFLTEFVGTYLKNNAPKMHPISFG